MCGRQGTKNRCSSVLKGEFPGESLIPGFKKMVCQQSDPQPDKQIEIVPKIEYNIKLSTEQQKAQYIYSVRTKLSDVCFCLRHRKEI